MSYNVPTIDMGKTGENITRLRAAAVFQVHIDEILVLDCEPQMQGSSPAGISFWIVCDKNTRILMKYDII